MSTVDQRSFWVRNRWALPLLLALIIAAIVLGALFGPKLKDALASKTATPTPTATASPTSTPQAPVTVVVTATPGPGGTPAPTTQAPTTQAATSNCPVATPGVAGGASTPLPQATPVPTVAGLCLGMITRQQYKVQQAQTGADNKDPNFTYYLDPIQVVNRTLPTYGFKDPFQIVQPTRSSPSPTPFPGADGRPLVKAIVRYHNQLYTVQVAQPGVRGPKGIWLIVTILQGQS